MKVIAFANVKGGVGKSTLCYLFSRWLSACKKKVLVIDSDPQNALTQILFDPTKDNKNKTLSKAIDDRSFDEYIADSWFDVKYVPSSFYLVDQRSLSPKTYKTMLENSNLAFDYILIDTPGCYDNFLLNAVVAADKVVVPMAMGSMDIRATEFTIKKLCDELDIKDLNKFIVVMNKWGLKVDAGLSAQYISQVKEKFGSIVFDDPVIFSIMVNKSVDASKKITRTLSSPRFFDSTEKLFKLISKEKAKVVFY